MIGHLKGFTFMDDLIPKVSMFMTHYQYHIFVFLHIQIKTF